MTPTPAVVLVDPRTGIPRSSYVPARAEEIDAAVRRARRGARAWASLTSRERAKRMTRLAALIEHDQSRIIAAECSGTGKLVSEAEGELGETCDLIRFYAIAARAGTAPAGGNVIDGHESWVRWEPIGVVGAILPWNYPLLMLGWRCAAALAAGNSVVVKPAQTTPESALLVEAYAAEALGPDVVTVVPGDRETGRHVARSAVDAIAFTGSAVGGTDVTLAAGPRPMSLELGGNGPVVILPDAPPETWSALAQATVYNAGQNCAAPARVLTLSENYEQTVACLGEALGNMRAGIDFGPLNSRDQADRYRRMLGLAATVKTGPILPTESERAGHWVPSAVAWDLPADHPLIQEEVFGPLLTVQAFDGIESIVRSANGMSQALAGSVWSESLTSALGLARRLNVGEAWINCHLVQTAELPHGGRGASGTGTDLSILALNEFRRPKTITARLTGP